MTANKFSLRGSYEALPTVGQPSGAPVVAARLAEDMFVDGAPVSGTYTCTNVETPVSVALGPLDGFHLAIIKVEEGGSATAQLTSAAGEEQLVPVGSFALLISESVPFTALALLAVADTKVTVILAKKG